MPVDPASLGDSASGHWPHSTPRPHPSPSPSSLPSSPGSFLDLGPQHVPASLPSSPHAGLCPRVTCSDRPPLPPIYSCDPQPSPTSLFLLSHCLSPSMPPSSPPPAPAPWVSYPGSRVRVPPRLRTFAGEVRALGTGDLPSVGCCLGETLSPYFTLGGLAPCLAPCC